MNWKLFQLFLVVVPLKIAISADVETDWWNIIRVSGSYQMYSYCDSVWWTDFCFNSILTFWITHDISIYKKEKIQWNSVYFLETFRFFSINFCFFPEKVICVYEIYRIIKRILVLLWRWDNMVCMGYHPARISWSITQYGFSLNSCL